MVLLEHRLFGSSPLPEMGASEFQVSSRQCGTVTGALASDRLPCKSCDLFKLDLWTERHGLLELAQVETAHTRW